MLFSLPLGSRLLVFGVFFSLGSGSAYAKDSVPDWVRTAANQPTASVPPSAPAVVLLDETVLTVGTDGKAVEHHRHVVKILRVRGRDEGIAKIAFDNDSKILSLKVWSIAPDGHEYAMKEKEMPEVGIPNSGSMYEDTRVKVAEPPGLDKGSVVAWEYEQRLQPYEHEDTWFFKMTFQSWRRASRSTFPRATAMQPCGRIMRRRRRPTLKTIARVGICRPLRA